MRVSPVNRPHVVEFATNGKDYNACYACATRATSTDPGAVAWYEPCMDPNEPCELNYDGCTGKVG